MFQSLLSGRGLSDVRVGDLVASPSTVQLGSVCVGEKKKIVTNGSKIGPVRDNQNWFCLFLLLFSALVSEFQFFH